jgi:hypothetical protein
MSWLVIQDLFFSVRGESLTDETSNIMILEIILLEGDRIGWL